MSPTTSRPRRSVCDDDMTSFLSGAEPWSMDPEKPLERPSVLDDNMSPTASRQRRSVCDDDMTSFLSGAAPWSMSMHPDDSLERLNKSGAMLKEQEQSRDQDRVDVMI